ncbi:MAG: DUF3305 domain-containing protein [Rhodobacteraceae bacterium]|nr:DUF3305 domain-containing protein [Paracoccaceae bacterium]
MRERDERRASLPLGVVLRRSPGVTRWAKWSWTVAAVVPGGGPGHWTELRRDGESAEFHAATVPLELHRSETEGYLVALNGRPPSVYVILRPPPVSETGRPEVSLVTASAFEAQDYADNGEDIVERVPMPDGLAAWVGEFCRRHHAEEPFYKRKRGPRVDASDEDGRGDARIRQASDVYRAPGTIPKAGS